jgi:hypothetical protein
MPHLSGLSRFIDDAGVEDDLVLDDSVEELLLPAPCSSSAVTLNLGHVWRGKGACLKGWPRRCSPR